MGFAQINPRTLSSIQRCCRRHHHYHKYAANVLFNCFKMQSWRIYSKMPQFVLCRNLSQECFNFPWRQNAVDNSKDDPIHHKLFGMILLRRVFKNYTREDFSLIDFIDGVKMAVKALSLSIRSQDQDGHMIRMLGNDLHDSFRRAFDEMKRAKQNIFLEIENSKDFRISGVRAVCGSADPDDEYCIKFLGQKIITSKHDMFELEKRSHSAGYSALFEYGRKLGYSAAEKQLKFQIDVQFITNERFYVEEDRDGSWQIAFGNYDVISTAHNMRFESTLEDTSESNDNFPFSWKITNIDFEDDKNED